MPRVKVFVTLKPSLLDAQGRVIQSALASLGHTDVKDVRVGKIIEMEIGDSVGNVADEARRMCDRLLANPVIEDYRIEVGA